PRHPGTAGGGAPRAHGADRLRGEPAGVHLSRAGGPRPRLSPRPRLRRPRGRPGDGVRRAAPPRAAHLRGGGGRHGRGPRHRQNPGGRRRAVTYAGRDRRSAAPSPVRARRRVVTPDVLRQVKAIELRTRGLVNSLFTGEYRSVFRGQGIEFAEVRAYQQGDDFRAIDWNVSARMGHPFVKTFHEEREITVLLLVDQSGSCQFGRPYTKAGLAVEVAAVLALAAARHNDRVGALMFADKVEFVVRPAKGRRHERGRTAAVRGETAAPPLDRRRVVGLPGRRLGGAPGPARRRARRGGDHDRRSAGARDPRRRVGGPRGRRDRPADSRGHESRTHAGAAARRGGAAVARAGAEADPGRGGPRRAAYERAVRGAAAPRLRGAGAAAGAMSGLGGILFALQAAGVAAPAAPAAPSVGDTIWIVRAIAAPPGWRVRPDPLEPGEAVTPLGEPAVARGPEGWVIRY